MKAAVVTEPGVIQIQEVPEPEAGPYGALVQVLACGFCSGTDAKIVQGRWPGLAPFPFILGHETVARVLDVGSKVRNLKIGDLILGAHSEAVPELGLGSAWGGFVECAVATDWQAMLEDGIKLENEFLRTQQTIPAEIDLLDAVMIITLKETYSALQHFGASSGQPVLIIGDGPVGASLTLCARHLGAAPVIVAGHHDVRLELARSMGATHTINSHQTSLHEAGSEIAPKGFALVIDAVGNNRLLQEALNLLVDGGTIGVYGYADERQATLDWSRAPSRWSLHNLVVPQLDRLVEAHQPIVDWMQSGDLKSREMVSHVLPIEEMAKAYLMIESREAFKVVVQMKS